LISLRKETKKLMGGRPVGFFIPLMRKYLHITGLAGGNGVLFVNLDSSEWAGAGRLSGTVEEARDLASRVVSNLRR
jgi:hypothetical protein